MKTALVIPIYNRPQYVKRCFDSLRKLTTWPSHITLINDGSEDNEGMVRLMGEFGHGVHKKTNVKIITQKNEGVKKTLLFAIEDIINAGGIDLVINLDSDAIVSPDFVERLVKLHFRTNAIYADHIVSGFNNPKEPILHSEEKKGYCFKRHANGINMCFNREQYEQYIKPALLSDGNWDYNTKAESFAITIPSCVQHIGVNSSMGHLGADRAKDFKLLSVPNVTLFGIDSHDIKGIERAAEISQSEIDFGAVKIITDDLFTKGGNTEQRRKDYSRFMLKDLNQHFTTSHVLTIHADGYVVNANAWDDNWLQYDYIGATWWYKDGMNVGNGGFSLRSKKLCDILAKNEIDTKLMHPEDHCICRYYRESLEKDFGIKFAPEEAANRFSIEAYSTPAPANKYSGQFGFHSSHVDFNGSDVPEEWRYKKVVAQPHKQKLYPVRRK